MCGVPQSVPSCAAGQKSEDVFAKLKEANPSMTAILYWNTRFNFAFYAADQRMLALEAHGQRAFLRDEHGEVVLLCNDCNAYMYCMQRCHDRLDLAGRRCGRRGSTRWSTHAATASMGCTPTTPRRRTS